MLEILTLFFSSSTPEKGLEIKLFTPVFTASITCPFVRSDVTNHTGVSFLPFDVSL
jgi:hypothetical protein